MKTKFIVLSLVIVPLFFSNIMIGQEIRSFHSVYDDSFRDWEISYVQDPFEEDPPYLIGQLQITWGINNDWSEWNYRSDDRRGNIKLRGSSVSPHFEMVDQNAEVYIAKNIWPRDYSEWKITFKDTEYTVKQKFKSDIEEWIVYADPKAPFFTIVTQSVNDLRDWELAFLSDTILPYEIQQFVIFIVIYNSCPKI